MAKSQKPDFEVERTRLLVASSLPANCADDFQRLSRTLLHGPAFQWLLVDAPADRLRQQVMDALDEVMSASGLQVNRLPLSARIADIAELEARLVKNAAQAQVVHVIGRPGWFTPERWQAFNVRRERIAEQARARLVFWVDEVAIAAASAGAPDLWAWRAGVYAFVPESAELAVAASEARLAMGSRPGDFDPRTMPEKYRRIATIRSWLAAHPSAEDELLVAPLDELGRLLYVTGQYDEALAHWRQRELPLHRRLGNLKSVAITQGQIADVLAARGQMDEALRIRREEQLPVYEQLGDVRSRAITQGKIADVLQTRGQLDEALRIRREEELPVYEQLGDVRLRAITQGLIADVLEARGQLDEALRIRREEQLPVYDQLGDVRERAIALWKIGFQLMERSPAERRAAVKLLNLALADLRAMQLPEAEDLATQMRSRGLTPAEPPPPAS